MKGSALRLSFGLVTMALAIWAPAALAQEREERGLLDFATDAVKSAMNPLGYLEQKISPEGFDGYCKYSGYNLWVGEGPEPQPGPGALQTAMDAWGHVSSLLVGAWAPEFILQGKCEPRGWAKPGTEFAQTHYRRGSPAQYTPGTPGTTQTYVIPGQPGTYTPGTPGTSQTYVIPGTPGQYNPGTPGTQQTYVTPGQPGSYTPGTPGSTIVVQQPQQPQQQPMCPCPCNG